MDKLGEFFDDKRLLIHQRAYKDLVGAMRNKLSTVTRFVDELSKSLTLSPMQVKYLTSGTDSRLQTWADLDIGNGAANAPAPGQPG